MVEHISVPGARPYSVGSKAYLARWNSVHKQVFQKREDLAEFVSQALMQRKIVGWYQGRSEFGPRALGNRSILIRPDCVDTAARLSRYVKKRAGFRPYALSMTYECAQKVLECKRGLC